MWNDKTPNKKKRKRKVISIIIVILAILLIFRNRISPAFSFLDGIANDINFRLIKVKSMIYNKTSSFKTKIEDINYINSYIEKNINRDFELQKSKIQNTEITNIRAENEKLRKLLEMKEKSPAEYIAADVALVEVVRVNERIFINKGENDNVILNLPVVYDGYLIGKITKVGKDHSEVTLLTAKNSKISVVLNDGEVQILRGNGNGTFSVNNYNGIVNEKMSFNIETSGVSDIYPKGLRIGTFVIDELNAFKQMKELRFTPSYKLHDIQSVLVYKWSGLREYDKEIQEQIDIEIEEEFRKNKGTTQTN